LPPSVAKRALIWAVGAALIATGVAAAKGANDARVCGASGCRMVTSPEEVDGLTNWWGRSYQLRPAPRPAPFFIITLLSDTQRPISRIVYAPSRRAVRIAPVSSPPLRPFWRRVPVDRLAVFRAASEGLRPYPKSRTWRPRP
jgi:hypothetical protein